MICSADEAGPWAVATDSENSYTLATCYVSMSSGDLKFHESPHYDKFKITFLQIKP